MSVPDTATLREFADIARVKPGYVTELKATGRLVLTDAGDRVRVAESLQRIEDTRDPSKLGVARRHAEARAQQAAVAAADAPGEASDDDGDDEAGDDAEPASRAPAAPSGYQAARTVRERYLAMSAKRDYELSIGKLLPAADVSTAAGNAANVLRTRLESLPDVIAPELAVVTDEAKVHEILRTAIEHMLAELSRQFLTLGKSA